MTEGKDIKVRDLSTGETEFIPLPEKEKPVMKSSLPPKFDPPMLHIARTLIKLAITPGQEASDIHIFGDSMEIKFRIDGILQLINTSDFYHNLKPEEFFTRLISMFKVMANMDIAERRLPQDGRFKMKIVRSRGRKETEFSFRVSTLPGQVLEKMTIRILDPQAYKVSLDNLGHGRELIRLVDHLTTFETKRNLLVMAGATGQGKTTTQYAIIYSLYEASGGQLNIVTVEDPIEYELQGITQIQVKHLIGLDFPKALRSVVRADPDIIIIGEIRDEETAAIAIRAAQSGHLVFCTVHASDPIHAIRSLENKGISPSDLADNLLGIISQVLLRRICPHCHKGKRLRVYSPHEKSLEVLYGKDVPPYRFLYPQGCDKCQEGLRGRTAASSILIPSKEIRRMIARKASLEEIEAQAYTEGYVDMIMNARYKVRKVITTVEEAARVLSTDFSPDSPEE